MLTKGVLFSDFVCKKSVKGFKYICLERGFMSVWKGVVNNLSLELGYHNHGFFLLMNGMKRQR